MCQTLWPHLQEVVGLGFLANHTQLHRFSVHTSVNAGLTTHSKLGVPIYNCLTHVSNTDTITST